MCYNSSSVKACYYCNFSPKSAILLKRCSSDTDMWNYSVISSSCSRYCGIPLNIIITIITTFFFFFFISALTWIHLVSMTNHELAEPIQKWLTRGYFANSSSLTRRVKSDPRRVFAPAEFAGGFCGRTTSCENKRDQNVCSTSSRKSNHGLYRQLYSKARLLVLRVCVCLLTAECSKTDFPQAG